MKPTPTIIPLGTRLVIRPSKTRDENRDGDIVKGTIIIPKAIMSEQSLRDMESPHVRSVIVAVGPECSASVKVGDTIICHQQAVFVIRPEIAGEETSMVLEKDVYCVVR